jgi:hypothetical protein
MVPSASCVGAIARPGVGGRPDRFSLRNVIVFGQFSGQIEFDPGSSTVPRVAAGGSDIFACKLDPMGNYTWVTTFGSSGNDAAYSKAVDRWGNIYIAGWFHNSIDFDPGPGVFTLKAGTNGSAVIVKLSSNGNLAGAKQIVGTSTTSFVDIAVDRFANVYASGQLCGTADLDPGSATFTATSNSSGDAFAIKLDAGGNFVWGKQVGRRVGGTLQISFRGHSGKSPAGWFFSRVQWTWIHVWPSNCQHCLLIRYLLCKL